MLILFITKKAETTDWKICLFLKYRDISVKMNVIYSVIYAKKFASKLRRQSLASRERELEERVVLPLYVK
jgi:hypothetical protein